MNSMTKLYIDEIANSLASGHAAILVGAGFSRNSNPANDSVTGKVPLWSGLIDIFCDKLGIEENQRNYLSTFTIAQEVETSYGRPFLDKLIIDAMKDDSYVPSDIHVNLMSLPWTDVFTTNYDTLLERACEKVQDRRYKIVRDQKDLLYSSGGPRLVKLHGSFPSSGPFIITEEDYRRYPYDYAPFVNTVQQALLENTFVLIGFSGNDPNFMKWIGWIHDNLGLKNSPKIFLITDKPFSEAKTKNLSAKNIELVVLNQITKYRDDDITEVYRRFVFDLKKKVEEKQQTLKSWPDINSFSLGKDLKNAKELNELLRKTHSTYPGWIVAPYRKHSSISYIADKVENYWYYSKKEEDAKNNLTALEYETSIVYEYCWLHEILGRPVFSYVTKKIENLLKNYEGFLSKEREGSASADNNTYSADDIRKLRKEYDEKYLFVMLTLLRSYRINGDEEHWTKIYNKINEFIKNNRVPKNYRNRFVFEDILHDIYNLKFNTIASKVDQICCDDNQSIWALRKAGLLAMDGQYEDAEQLTNESLNNIRYNLLQNSSVHNFKYLSIESCLVSLHNFIHRAKKLASGTFDQQTNDLIEERDKNYKYDFIWDNENNHYSDVLSDKYENVEDSIETPLYDIGRSNYSTSINRNSKDIMEAYDFLGFREITGVPFRLGSYTFKEGVLGASKRLAQYNAFTPLVLGVLVSDNKLIKEVCNRTFIAGIEVDKIDKLCDSCMDNIRDSMSSIISNRHFWANRTIREFPVQVMPEILSRLCSKCSKGKFNAIIDILVEIYNSSLRDIIDLRDFQRRVIETIPLNILLEKIDSFWSLPYMKAGLIESTYYPEIFGLIYERFLGIASSTNKEEFRLPMTTYLSGLLDNMYDLALKDEGNSEDSKHKSIIRRITYISQIYSLSVEEKKKLSYIIAAPNNKVNGKPYLGDFYPSVIDQFVEPEDEKYSNNCGGSVDEKGKEFIKLKTKEQDDLDQYIGYADKKSPSTQAIRSNSNGLNNIIGDEEARKLRSSVLAKELEDFIAKVKENSEAASLTDYTNFLNGGISIVQHSAITEQNVKDISKAILLFVKKLDNHSTSGIYIDFLPNSIFVGMRLSGVLIGECLLKAGLASSEKAYSGDIQEINEIRELLVKNEIPCSLLKWCTSVGEERESNYIRGLFSGDNHASSDGINTLYRLANYGCSVGDRTIDLIVKSLITANDVNCNSYVLAVEYLSRKGILTDKQIRPVIWCLKKLNQLTTIKDIETDDIAAEKLLLRRSGAYLAHTLYVREKNEGIEISSEIAQWKAMAQSPEEFAEIRNCWDEISENAK